MPRSRTRDLRLPFVVTLSVGAAAVACGGMTSGESGPGADDVERGGAGGTPKDGAGSGSEVGSGGWTATGGAWTNPPDYELCPGQLPQSGTACNVDPERSCRYGEYDESSARCVGGQWDVTTTITSCNPPPCTDVYMCPASPPSDGAPCNLDPDIHCTWGYDYDYYCADMSEIWAECVQGSWMVGEYYVTCNPPYVECPERPMPGAPCDPGYYQCWYYDERECSPGQWSYEDRYAYCTSDGTWQVDIYGSLCTTDADGGAPLSPDGGAAP
jgi:hypothetical protein